jgi:hypothetical protein
MSHVTAPITPKADAGGRLRKLLIDVLMICAVVVFFMAFELVGNRLNANRWDWDIREISVLKISVVVSIYYMILQYFLPRVRQWRSELGVPPEFASKPDGEDALKRDR